MSFFTNMKCNSVEIIAQARNTYHYTILCNKNTNMGTVDNIAGKSQYFKSERTKVNTWRPTQFDYPKWNIDALRIEAKSSSRISFVWGIIKSSIS